MTNLLFVILFLGISSQLNDISEEDIRKLISQLGDDNFKVRMEAADQLIAHWKIDKVRSLLTDYAEVKCIKSPNGGEIIEQCKELLERIEFRKNAEQSTGKTLDNHLLKQLEEFRNLSEKQIINRYKSVIKEIISSDNKENNTDLLMEITLWVSLNIKGADIKQEFMEQLISQKFKPRSDIVASFLKDEVSQIRWLAIQTLKGLGAKEYSQRISEFLHDPDVSVKQSAIYALAAFGAKEFSKNIAELLDEPGLPNGYAVVNTLWKLGAKEYSDKLAEILKTTDSAFVKAQIMEAFVVFNETKYAKEIAEHLNCKFGFERRIAIWALGKLNAKEYSKQIAEKINDHEPWQMHTTGWTEHEDFISGTANIPWSVRATAIWSLVKIGAKEYTQEIVKCLLDDAVNVRVAAIWGLTTFQAVEKVDEIAMLLGKGDPKIKVAVLCALGILKAENHKDTIAKYLRDYIPHVRAAAVWALGMLKATKYKEKIAFFLEDSSSYVRGAAVWAMGELGASEYLEKIQKLTSDTAPCFFYDVAIDDIIAYQVSFKAEEAVSKLSK
ncbi:MAG: HEAT repeat domain-containing protein [Planctomycetes bacterium]|nr:HEAT repeat domain-containing protein [Planctomycetota bacterium]